MPKKKKDTKNKIAMLDANSFQKILKENPDILLRPLRAEASEVSLDDIREILWQAVRKKGENVYMSEVFGQYLIYHDEDQGKYFKVGYSILDGEAVLGTEETEVEKTWVENRSAQDEADDNMELTLRIEGAQDAEGKTWDVTICEPGFTKNGWYLEEDVLRDAAALFEGVDVNLFELPEATHVPDALFGMKSLLVKNKAGWIDNVKYVAGRGLAGMLHFLDSAAWLGKNILSAMKDGEQMYGLSYDCPVRAKKDTVDGKSVFRALKFLAADSVDIVSRPAAGGKFNRAIAAHNEEDIMNKKDLWDLIHQARPDLLKEKDFDTITDEEMTTLARMAMEPMPKEPENTDGDGGGQGDDKKPLTQKDIDMWRCEMSLDKALEASKLPDKSKARIRTMFDDKVFKNEDLQRAIADEQDYLAELTKTADEGDTLPSSDMRVGIGTIERAQMAMDKTFGLTKEDMVAFAGHARLDNKPFFADMRSKQDYDDFDDVPAFEGLRDMYLFFTGDNEVTGRFNRKALPPDLRAKMDITSATFTYILGNTMGRRMVKDYRETNFQEDLLISVRKPVRDFRQQEAVNVGYFGNLDTVDPESADYEEIDGVTDEESTYTIGQKGNILTITRKTIINDDITLIMRLLGRLGRAARRTFAEYVWAFFIDNSTCSDGTAWFTSGHGNLGSNGLSFAYALTAYKALAKMTEKDSSKRIGMLDDPSVKPALVYPVDIVETGESIVNDEFYYSSDDLTTKTRNPLKGKINGAMVSIFTDANDWGLLMPPSVVDMVEMGFLNGRQEPEMFVADSPQAEQVFVADKIRHKIRHEYAGAVVDFRSGYKAEVA